MESTPLPIVKHDESLSHQVIPEKVDSEIKLVEMRADPSVSTKDMSISNQFPCKGTSIQPTFPFLLLSCEIRLQIYNMLAPNAIFPANTLRSECVNLRTNGEFCYPAILQVNRQIYNEAMYEWYAQTTFNAAVRYHSYIATLDIFRQSIQCLSNIPTAFYYISCLKIKLYLEDPHSPAKVRQGYTAMLYQLFPKGSNPRCLKSLEVDLFLAEGYWSRKEFRRMLECHIHPFRHFGGYEKIKFTLNFEELSVMRIKLMVNYRRPWYAHFAQDGRRFFKKLDEDMYSVPRTLRCGCT